MSGGPRLRDHAGRCAWCKGTRRLKQPPLYRTEASKDPFCSRSCCESWYAKYRGITPFSSSTGMSDLTPSEADG